MMSEEAAHDYLNHLHPIKSCNHKIRAAPHPLHGLYRAKEGFPGAADSPAVSAMRD